jgi:transcriptional regulator with XRE-family HTH domain
MIDPEFGKRLKKERENYFDGIPKAYSGRGRPREKYPSQAVLARIIGVSQSAVGEWENGKSYPAASRVVQLAELFGVEHDHFIEAIVKDKFYRARARFVQQEDRKIFTEKGSNNANMHNINFIKKVFENL